MNIGRAIKIRLLHLEKSQRWLSNEINVTDSWLSAVTNNKIMPTFGRFVVVAEGLGLKGSELLKQAEDLE